MTTNELHHAAARHIATGIARGYLDDLDLEALHSDAGLMVGDVVVWHRLDDDMVVGWLGNDLDDEMNKIAEVPVDRGAPSNDLDPRQIVRPIHYTAMTPRQYVVALRVHRSGTYSLRCVDTVGGAQWIVPRVRSKHVTPTLGEVYALVEEIVGRPILTAEATVDRVSVARLTDLHAPVPA